MVETVLDQILRVRLDSSGVAAGAGTIEQQFRKIETQIPKTGKAAMAAGTNFKDFWTNVEKTDKPITTMNERLKQSGTSLRGLKDRVVDFGSRFKTMALGFSTAAIGIVGLIHGYDDLMDMQIQVDRATNQLLKAQKAKEVADIKVNKLIAEGKTGTQEYSLALQQQTIATNNQALKTRMLSEAQEEMQKAMTTFALQLIPTLIGSFVALQDIMGKISKAKIVDFFTRLGGVFGGLTPSLSSATVAMNGLNLSAKGLIATLGPIALIIGGIAAAWFLVQDAMDKASQTSRKLEVASTIKDTTTRIKEMNKVIDEMNKPFNHDILNVIFGTPPAVAVVIPQLKELNRVVQLSKDLEGRLTLAREKSTQKTKEYNDAVTSRQGTDDKAAKAAMDAAQADVTRLENLKKLAEEQMKAVKTTKDFSGAIREQIAMHAEADAKHQVSLSLMERRIETAKEENTTLLEQAQDYGMLESQLDKYMATEFDTLDVVNKKNAGLQKLNITLASNVKWVSDATTRQELFNQGMLKGTEDANEWYKQLLINKQAGQDFHGQLVAIAKELGIDVSNAMNMTSEDLQQLIEDFEGTEAAVKRFGDAVKGALKEQLGKGFSIINVDSFKEAKKNIKEFLKDIDLGKGSEKRIKLQLEADFKAKEAIDKAQSQLTGIILEIKAGISEEDLDADIDRVIGNLQKALAKGADVQPLIDLLTQIRNSESSSTALVSQLSKLSGLSAEQILTDTTGLLDKLNLDSPAAIKALLELAKGTEATGKGAESAQKPLNEFQQQMKDIQDLNKVMNTHYIAGLNAMGNKTEEFRNFAGSRIKAVRNQVVSDLQAMNKVMNTHFIAGINAMGNKTSQFKSVANSNFKSVSSTLSKLAGDINKVKTAMNKLDGSKATITIDVKATGRTDLLHARGGVELLTRRTMTAAGIGGEAGPELHAFFPLRTVDQPKKGAMDIVLPTAKPKINIKGLRSGVEGMTNLTPIGKGSGRQIIMNYINLESILQMDREVITRDVKHVILKGHSTAF